MAEVFKEERVVFTSGKQRAFLERVIQQMSVADAAHACLCSERTIRDWRREKFSISLSAVRTLSTYTGVPIPKNIHVHDAYTHNAKASRLGAAATIKKYGRIPHDEEHRKEQWRLWWESTGKFKKNPILETKAVHKPKRNVELAEFIGIMLGDGGISTYQIVVTLHHTDDLEYASHVINLMKKLFKVNPKIYHFPKKSVNNIVVSRRELVKYLHELGLPIGNKIKHRIDIPEWIKKDPKLSIACLRGLVDTDGCIFTHRYKVKGTWYVYKKLSFTSASNPLRHSVHTLLQEFGFHSRIADTDVRLDRIEDMKQYFSAIGSHNPKHLRRYRNTVG
ncbi:MAG: LAGLIDADG family homing endonuclease [Candidatus Pacebacteria bacterium]|nr:LAGLIDADG family homing endonuclease [Candidatus Paceibacterota bacterium]